MNNEASNLYAQAVATAESAGIWIHSTLYDCRLLALVYADGNEACVFNPAMLTDIRHAMKHTGIRPGAVVSQEVRALFTACVRELEQPGHPPEWAQAMAGHYGFTLSDRAKAPTAEELKGRNAQ